MMGLAGQLGLPGAAGAFWLVALCCVAVLLRFSGVTVLCRSARLGCGFALHYWGFLGVAAMRCVAIAG